ncbi:ubiquitin-conjugating enzyme E2 S [Cavenderia fasciculata]|uniref:E2 ubiquitin-conjugating enzyme n=1 Tax=Cavenderia fasciculata TaxID=261658 RepID=F4PM86_CACFS|nr:ubiquitin-conjugating enzyme E2 S [Cavenderia fasciculata]EGG23586.1 ubiquitin-conjugating enzyme E2 S [Cavenderia fasciculata]|eukprot:XP_004361437.1 ubiquitin-conjugating enzyme E2 S [Cavenderia fasciculata]
MSSENLPPDVIKRILRELKELSNSPMEGISLVPCEEDLSNIDAIIHGPGGTPYEGGHFKARLTLSSDFPRSPPKANFITKIFHPNVSKKGEICVNTLKKDWSEDLGIKHILLTIKCLLIVPNAESSLNEDASRLLLENYDDYCKHAKMFTSIHASKSLAPTTTIDSNDGANNNNNNLSTETSSSSSVTAAAKKKTVDKPDAAKAKKSSLKRFGDWVTSGNGFLPNTVI